MVVHWIVYFTKLLRHTAKVQLFEYFTKKIFNYGIRPKGIFMKIERKDEYTFFICSIVIFSYIWSSLLKYFLSNALWKIKQEICNWLKKILMNNYIIILFHLNYHLFIKIIRSNMSLDILISSKNVDQQANFKLKKY